MPENLSHPTPEKLGAFSLGQLPLQEAAVIEAHITECKPCCDTLLGISEDDTFVSLLKETDRASGDATVDLGLTPQPGSQQNDVDAPQALLSHKRYRVVGLVGRGGMGDVYKAEHRLMERTVALKVINRSLINKPEAVERFHREVRAAAQLHHPNIVTAFDAEQAGDVHFLAMEFVEGTALSEVVNQRGPLPVDEAVDYIRQAAVGLQHAHEMGMVHRDIKPHNLMLDVAGNVKILDFGLASFASETPTKRTESDDAQDKDDSVKSLIHLTQIGTTMGTPDYIAPEQAEDARIADIRSDIYSLGCTLYFLLAGRAPFPVEKLSDKLRAHARSEPQSLDKFRSDLPAGLEAVVRTMMAKDPVDRYQTPEEAGDALAELLVQAPKSTSLGEANLGRFEYGIRFGVGAAIAACFGAFLRYTGANLAEAGLAMFIGLLIAWGATHWAMANSAASRRREWELRLMTLAAISMLAVTGVVALVGSSGGSNATQKEHTVQGAVTRIFSNMTADEFRLMDHGLRTSNHRPIQLIGHVVDGESRFDVIWKQDPAVKFQTKAFVDLSPAEFQKKFDKLTEDGYRLTRISGYAPAGKEQYAGIFEKRDGPRWKAKMGLSESRFQELFEELSGEGYRMIDFNAFTVRDKPYVASIWEHREGPDWQARPGLPPAEFQKLSDQLIGQGYHPLRISGYVVGKEARYASLWEQGGDAQWQALIDLPREKYQRKDKELAAKGFGKVQLSELEVDDVSRYTVIWEKRDAEEQPASDLDTSDESASDEN